MTRIIDQEYEHGPTKNRKRTDLLCYAFFLALVSFSALSFTQTYKKSNLNEFLTPVDFFGN
jgi:hypothetical protein